MIKWSKETLFFFAGIIFTVNGFFIIGINLETGYAFTYFLNSTLSAMMATGIGIFLIIYNKKVLRKNLNCDCSHTLEDHKHPVGLQYCKKCDCDSFGHTSNTKIDYGESQ